MLLSFQYTDEEVERCYEEFYEDVHTEFLKFGEIINFKVLNSFLYFSSSPLYPHHPIFNHRMTNCHLDVPQLRKIAYLFMSLSGVQKWCIPLAGKCVRTVQCTGVSCACTSIYQWSLLCWEAGITFLLYLSKCLWISPQKEKEKMLWGCDAWT